MIVVGCRRCNRAFVYTDRDKIDKLCPDCDNGPFDDWFRIVSTADELMADGGHKSTDTDDDLRTDGGQYRSVRTDGVTPSKPLNDPDAVEGECTRCGDSRIVWAVEQPVDIVMELDWGDERLCLNCWRDMAQFIGGESA